MPRQRKPQNGGQRLGTWRVANTTTGSTTQQAVYRIPTWNRRDCDVRNFEVTWTSPIAVAIEWENVYRISLDAAALENVIEGMNLDLSNVTLETINGDVAFTGSVSVDGTFTWTTITADTVNATTGNITNITSSDITTASVTADSANIDWLAVNNNATVGGTLGVTWAVTLNDTLSVEWVSTFTWDVSTVNIASSWVATLNEANITTAVISWPLDVDWGVTIDSWLTVNSGDTTTKWIIADWNLNVSWVSTLTGNVNTGANLEVGWDLDVSWASEVENLTVNWNEIVTWTSTLNGATTLNSTLSVAWASTLTWNVTAAQDLTVAWNEIISWNSTVVWNTILSWITTINWATTINNKLTVTDDIIANDDLVVNWATSLNTLETSGSASIWNQLTVAWAATIHDAMTVDWQLNSNTIRATEIVTDELRVNTSLDLTEWATAPDFVLQSEKGQPNWVAPLNADGKIDTSYLPPVYTSAIVKMWVWVFSNSDTSVVVDADIKADSFVIISNYQDIIWDLNETINVWQLTVVSNQTETWSYKYIVVNALS